MNLSAGMTFEEAAELSSFAQLTGLGRAIDVAVDGGHVSDEVTALQGLDEDALIGALEQLQPSANQGITRVLHHQSLQLLRTQSLRAADAGRIVRLATGAGDSLASADAASAALPHLLSLMQDRRVPVGLPAFHVQSINDLGRVDRDEFSPSQRYNSHGVDAGVQLFLTDNLLASGSAAVVLSDLDGQSGSGEIDATTLHAAGQLTWFTPQWRFDAGLSYGHAFNDSKRPITALDLTAKGDYHTDLLGASFAAAYLLECDGWDLEPFAAVQYVHVIDHGYTETGAGALNLTLRDNTTNSLRPSLGLRLAGDHDLGDGRMLRSRLSVAYEYEMLDDQVAVDVILLGSTVRNRGADIDRHSVRLSVGGDLRLNEQVTLFADYTATLNRDWQNHAINAGIRIAF